MHRHLLPLFLTALAVAQAPRTIRHTAEIDATPAELFALWTTTAGVRIVFPGADATIEGMVGGAFTVKFAPHIDPDGQALGTAGCKILELEQDRRLVFQWKGRPDFPVMNVEPLPTAVTLTFAALADDRCRLELAHGGFGHGKEWDAGFAYFDKAWRGVLDALIERHARQPVPSPEILALKRTTAFVVRLQPGPKWVEGKGPGEQPKILNHFLYMMRLAKDGRLLAGGACGETDGLGILLVPDRATAERLMAADPAVLAGVFVPKIEAWQTVLPDDLAAYRRR
ncbi:MAG: SRPBCC domain-containing protein [Planctomycetes bacterium]|nr:SRPBCC domain-containing protein [Planctomycetota bacterium]